MKQLATISLHRKIRFGVDRGGAAGRAFTIVELLVAMTILAAMMILLVKVIGATQRIYTSSQSKVEQFREARVAFEAVTRRLSQATLNTYWDYNDPNNPTRYMRQSELHFIAGPASTLLKETGVQPTITHAVFFQAPLGVADAAAYQSMPSALNAWGYFLTCDSDLDLATRPAFLSTRIPARTRCRLMEFRQPTERMSVYCPPNNAPSGFKGLTSASFGDVTAWFNTPAIVKDTSVSPTRIVSRSVAENIIALIVSPRSPVPPKSPTGNDYDIAPNYYYDSRLYLTDSNNKLAGPTQHQLPPTVQVTMVALDERSASQYETPSQSTGALVDQRWFQNVVSYDADLGELTSLLTSKRLNYEVFSTAVPIRAAKWSTVP